MSIPAYNEAKLIGKTLCTLPEFVDLAVVVDDGSTDGTFEAAQAVNDPRVLVLRNEQNQGYGFSVVRGFKAGLEAGADVLCLMAGDAQCDPSYLHQLIDAVIDDQCDYAKANRFFHRDALAAMPPFRRFGNTLLSILTKFATGYYSVFDTQNAYSAIRATTLGKLDLDALSPRYEFDNSYLLNLSMANARVKDIPVPAIYGDEQSTIKLVPFMRRTSWVLVKGFFQRIYQKYVLFGLHPVALFLFSGALLILWGLAFGLWTAFESWGPEVASTATVMLSVLPLLMGFQLVLFGILIDIMNEPR
jgi:glycosyltransferase involved in cell wall biosynthesis